MMGIRLVCAKENELHICDGITINENVSHQ